MGLPAREAEEKLREMKDDFKKMKFQEKRFARMVRTGKAQIPSA